MAMQMTAMQLQGRHRDPARGEHEGMGAARVQPQSAVSPAGGAPRLETPLGARYRPRLTPQRTGAHVAEGAVTRSEQSVLQSADAAQMRATSPIHTAAPLATTREAVSSWLRSDLQAEEAERKVAAVEPGPSPGGTVRRSSRLSTGESSRSTRNSADLEASAADIAGRIQARVGQGKPLPEDVSRDMQRDFGQDVSHVRIHSDRESASLARRVNADAFNVGQDIFVGEGRYSPNSLAGRRLLSHEIAHELRGVPGRYESDNPRLQRLADLLEDDQESDAISLMRQLSLSESQQVLDSSALRTLAVSAFNDEEMVRAVCALGGNLYGSLRWLFAEGNNWEDLRSIIVQWGEGYDDVRSSIFMRGLFVDLLDNEEMADLVDLLGGSLIWKLRWMKEEGSDWSLVSAKLNRAPSDQRLALYDDDQIRAFFVDICDNDTMATAADTIGGTVVQKFEWMYPEGANVSKLMSWVRGATLAERLALYSSGEATATAVEACNDREMRAMVDAIGGTVLEKLSWLLAEGEFDYMPEPGETLAPPPSEPATAYTKPVIFGVDRSEGRRRIYASVTYPGHTREAVAQYLYGRPDGSLLDNVPERLAPGTTIRLREGLEGTEEANNDLNAALRNGTVLSTEGEAALEDTMTPDGRILLYSFTGGGHQFQLTAQQMQGMLAGTARKMRIKASYIRGLAEDLKDVRDSHEEGTNWAVRNVSDVLGDVDLPDEHFADRAIDLATEARDTFRSVAPVTSIPDAQQAIGQAVQKLREAAHEYAVNKMRWRYYIQGTIEGASVATTVLQITRDVSFGIAAGLAGAVAAPFAFGAVAGALTTGGTTALTTGGALLAGGAAITTGTVAGATVKGALEFTGAAGGELAREAFTEGEQQFDWEQVGGRTWHGIRTGALEGGMGAASHFQSAYLASRFGHAFASSLRGQIAIGTISGGTSEFALATGEELFAPGEGGFSAMNVLKRTATGTLLGGATSVLPINGLYRVRSNGRVSFVPLRGQAVTPEWMVSSPWQVVTPGGAAQPGSSVAPRGTARYETAINNLPPEQLPVLPEGYAWARVNGNEWAIIRPPGQPDIDIHAWDVGPTGRPYYTVRMREPGGQPSRMVYSEAVAGPNTRPATQRMDPFPTADYTDPATGLRFRRGHGADHADTRATLGPTDATADPANFSAQTVEWNDRLRNQIVQWVRANRNPITGAPGAGVGPNPIYREVTYYGSSPARTANPGATPGAGHGSAIPDGVYFIVADASGVPQYAWHVRTSDALSGQFATGQGSSAVNSWRFSIPLNQVPRPILAAGGFQFVAPGAAMGAGGVIQREEERAP